MSQQRIQHYARRIVCLTEETTEWLYRLGLHDCIVGISGFTVRPKRARKEKPKVSLFTDADIDEIRALKPDLVLGFSDIQAQLGKDLVAAGLPVFIFNQRSLQEIYQSLLWIGALVGATRESEAEVEKLKARVETIAEKNRQGPRPRVYFEEWPDPMLFGIRWVSELIEVAGGQDIFADRRDASLGKDRIIRSEEVIEANPEIIIGSWCGKMFKPDQVMQRKGWKEISAVRNERLYEIPSALILQPGPAALTDGLDALCRIISPQKLPD